MFQYKRNIHLFGTRKQESVILPILRINNAVSKRGHSYTFYISCHSNTARFEEFNIARFEELILQDLKSLILQHVKSLLLQGGKVL